MCKHPKHLASVTSVQKHNTCAPTSPLISRVRQFCRKCTIHKLTAFYITCLFFLYKGSILIVRLNIEDYEIVCINLVYLKFVLFNDLIQCLKTIIRNKNVLNIYMIIIFGIKYKLYNNAHDRTIFIFLNIIIFLKIWCANLYAAPILPPPTLVICLRFCISGIHFLS